MASISEVGACADLEDAMRAMVAHLKFDSASVFDIGIIIFIYPLEEDDNLGLS